MKKGLLFGRILTAAVILILIGTVYAVTWLQIRNQSVVFYEHVKRSMETGNFGAALKGEELAVNDSRIFMGGLQHIMETWKSPTAWPKPRVYEHSRALYRTLLYEKMTADDGIAIFRQYFQLDLQYLDDVLLRTGDLFLEEGNPAQALDTYRTVREIFTLDEELQKTVEERIEKVAPDDPD